MKDSATSRKPKRSKNSEKSSESSKRKKSAAANEKRRSKRSKDNNRSHKSSRSRHVVMGLDLSLTGTGLVVWDGERVLRHRRYKTEPVSIPRDLKDDPPQGQLAPDRFKGEPDERIEWLRTRVALNIRKFGVALVIIESKHFAAKGKTKIIDELQGVIKNHLLRKEIVYVLVAPPTLKNFATGDGRASKTEMIAAAKKFDRSIGTDDEADALHLARFGTENWRKIVDD